MKKSLPLVMAGLVAVAFATAKPALAVSPTTFAAFNAPGTDNWVFDNTGSAGLFSTVSIPVSFTYGTANAYGAAGTPILGTLSVTATAYPNIQETSPPPPGGSPTVTDYTYLDSYDMVFTANTPVDGLTNLLTVDTNYSLLQGVDGSEVASVTGEGGSGESVHFSSDFLNFTGTSDHSLSVSLTSLSAPLSQNANGYLNSFFASGSGNFSTTPAPASTPEASSVVSFGALLMFGAIALIGRRRLGSRTA